MSNEQRRPLTLKQKNVYDALVDGVRARGFQPSMEEIGKLLGCKATNVRAHLGAIEKKKYIRITPGGMRAIEILDAQITVTVPPVTLTTDHTEETPSENGEQPK